MRAPPTPPSLLSRLYGFIQTLLGLAPRRLPPPPILKRPKLPEPVRVVARPRASPWDDLMDIGPEERTTLMEAPGRLTDPGAAPAQRPGPRRDGIGDRAPDGALTSGSGWS